MIENLHTIREHDQRPEGGREHVSPAALHDIPNETRVCEYIPLLSRARGEPGYNCQSVRGLLQSHQVRECRFYLYLRLKHGLMTFLFTVIRPM